MFTEEQLDNWFTYHAPTDATTPKYATIRRAEQDCHECFARIYQGAEKVTDASCDAVNAVTRTFAETLDTAAPDGADKAASMRCIRLARNAMNEWIMASVKGFPLHIDSFAEARRQLVMARWQANSAIACGGK